MRKAVDAAGLLRRVLRGDRVVVTTGDSRGDYGPQYILALLHAETSSLFWRSYRSFPALMPDEMEPFLHTSFDGRPTPMDVHRGATLDVADLTRHGFVSTYAATNYENDFNQVVSYLVFDPRRIRQLAMANPLISAKVEAVERAYRRIGVDIDSFGDRSWYRHCGDSPAERLSRRIGPSPLPPFSYPLLGRDP